ncbi:WYL domain-containing protein [Acinetobacter sichuanensis]|uniref:WYL domain-containing protein n=1 Tax=Acinetobacter sichuanensis TaxID=2136183 RepID=A0A371YJU8_9GAMM|nr:WYL domain-containing protein [Acinetobacter sichuanensis]RFC81759.1 hypothetical protein C9E89_020025 [Acinetobacter sichuanensis]
MIEILSIFLVAWIIYAWKTGKFKKEYQEKNNEELKKTWTDLKQSLKSTNSNLLTSDDLNNKKSEKTLSQKQQKLSLKEHKKHAKLLAHKFDTRTQIPEITIQHKRISPKCTSNNKNTHLNDFYTPEFEITYQSMGNHISIRDICFLELIKKDFEHNEYYYVEAFCFSSNDLRSFRVDRIIKIYDYESNKEYLDYKEILNLLKFN